MPVVSSAQQGLMALATTEIGRRKLHAHGKKPPSKAVANEFLQASKGIKNLPHHVRKK